MRTETIALSRSEAAKLGWQRARQAILTTRFWDRVDRSAGPDGCWPWTGARHERGYGFLVINRGQRVYAHRRALELTLGRDLGPGLVAMHSCDNPPCCNPAHLSEGTQADNIADMYAKGRAASQRKEALGVL